MPVFRRVRRVGEGSPCSRRAGLRAWSSASSGALERRWKRRGGEPQRGRYRSASITGCGARNRSRRWRHSEVQRRAFRVAACRRAVQAERKHVRGGVGKPAPRRRGREPQRGERQEGTPCRVSFGWRGAACSERATLRSRRRRQSAVSNGMGGRSPETGFDLRAEQGPEDGSSRAFPG
jgi:hypothetical protein